MTNEKHKQISHAIHALVTACADACHSIEQTAMIRADEVTDGEAAKGHTARAAGAKQCACAVWKSHGVVDAINNLLEIAAPLPPTPPAEAENERLDEMCDRLSAEKLVLAEQHAADLKRAEVQDMMAYILAVDDHERCAEQMTLPPWPREYAERFVSTRKRAQELRRAATRAADILCQPLVRGETP